MQISPSLFGLEESSRVSPANVERLANQMLDRYRTLMAENRDSFNLPAKQTRLLELRSKEAKSINALQKRTDLGPKL